MKYCNTYSQITGVEAEDPMPPDTDWQWNMVTAVKIGEFPWEKLVYVWQAEYRVRVSVE
jgi:hypothetical protein